MTSSGKPIKHADLVEQLFPAFYLPKTVAILKVKAHTRQDNIEAHGNHMADTAAKEAASGAVDTYVSITDTTPESWDQDTLTRLQDQASRSST